MTKWMFDTSPTMPKQITNSDVLNYSHIESNLNNIYP